MSDLQEAMLHGVKGVALFSGRMALKAGTKLTCFLISLPGRRRRMHPEKQGKMKLKTLLSYGRETSSCETGTQEIKKLDRMLKKTGLQYNLQPIVDGDGNELMRLTFQTKDRDVVKNVLDEFGRYLVGRSENRKESVIDRLMTRTIHRDKQKERARTREVEL